MTLRPPSFHLLLSLIGATLVLWGARNAVLYMPVLGEISLFEMDSVAAWTLTVAAAAAMVFTWMAPRGLAWASFLVAISAIGILCHDLMTRVEQVRGLGSQAALLVNRAMHEAQVKPGAVGVLAGIVILALALSLRSGPRSQVA